MRVGSTVCKFTINHTIFLAHYSKFILDLATKVLDARILSLPRRTAKVSTGLRCPQNQERDGSLGRAKCRSSTDSYHWAKCMVCNGGGSKSVEAPAEHFRGSCSQ